MNSLIKYFKHKGKYLFAVFLLVFSYAITCFTSLTASASASISEGIDFGVSAPVSLTANYWFYEVNTFTSLSASMTVTPNILPNFDDTVINSNTGGVDGNYDYSYTAFIYSYGDASYLDSVSGASGPVGYYAGSLFGPRLTSSSASAYALEDVFYSFSPFYCWGSSAFDPYLDYYENLVDDDRFFSYLSDYNSEILVSVYPNDDSDVSISSIEIGYQKVGSEFYDRVVISDPNLFPIDEFDYIHLTPSLFGDDDPNAVYYISSMVLNFDSLPTSAFSVDLVTDFHYTLNPFIQDYIYDYYSGSFPGSGSGNPSDGLIPYTHWIGEAVSGFFDAELFPGFTLGGVFMTLFSFSCVIWFLKLVAGG